MWCSIYLDYNYLGNLINWGAWKAIIHGVTKVRHDLGTKQQIISRFSLIELLPLPGNSFQHLILISPLMFIFPAAHLIFIKSRKKYIAFSFQIFLPITVVYCVDVVLIFKTLFFHNEFWRKKIFFSNLKAENWLSVFHCSPGTSHAWGRKPRWSWLLQEIEVVWKCKELDMTECLSMHAWKWIMKKQEFCEN